MNRQWRSALCMAVFVALWALIEWVGGHIVGPQSPYEVVWARYAVHLVLMLALLGWQRRTPLWRTKRPGYQVARSLLMVGMPAAFIIALQMGMSTITVMDVFFVSPISMLALARVLLAERVPRLAWVATAVASVGAWLTVGHDGVPSMLDLALPALMAATFSLYVVMTRSLRTEPTRVNLFYTALGVFVVLSPVMLRVWITPSPHDAAVMGIIGALGLVALYALDRAVAVAPVWSVAAASCLQAVFTVGLGVISGQAIVGRRALLGVAIVAGAVVMVGLIRDDDRDDNRDDNRAFPTNSVLTPKGAA